MKEKIVTILMLALILTSTLSMAFIIRPSLAEKGFLNENFMEKNRETSLPNQTNKPDQTSILNNDWRNIFERKLGAEQGKNLENPSQTSQTSADKWNFSDTSEWSNFTYIDGNKTRLIVGVNDKKPTSLLELERIAAEHQAKIIDTVSIGGRVRAVVVELLLVSVTAFVEETRAVELASYIEPNMKVQAQFIPNDPLWDMQWGPKKIEADWAWNITTGDPSVLVAVVDTGIYYTHPDLAANYVPLGYDWANMDNDPIDDHGHGTHCAGIIAAILNNSEGIAGLAQVRVMAEKVLTSGGGGYWDWVANGIINATDCGADIISMSLGGYGYSELVHEAVKYAYDAGVLIIAAAGNDNTNTKSYPAAYDEVIAVAATDQSDNKASFSNWGDWIELAAPGVSIHSTVPWGYESWSGTSMACPHVAGVAALIWSRYPSKTRDWIRLWLRYTADDLGDLGFDVYYGYGRINARKAVEQTPPAHELIASGWTTPLYVELGASGNVNATILNFGENNETNVTVQLLANDTIVDSTLIGSLVSGNSTAVSLTWNPTVEGLYNVTLYVLPVAGETNVENNVLWKYIYVGFPVKAVVLHSAGNIADNIITNWQALSSEWHSFGNTMVYVDYFTLNKEDITYGDIVATQADVLIISCAYSPSAGWEFSDSEIEAIKQYVHEGHGLIVTAGTFYYQVPNNNKLAQFFGLNETTMWTSTGTDLLHLVNTTHPIFTNVPDPLVFPSVGTSLPYDGRWDKNELVGGKYLALGHYQESAIVEYRGLVYISPWLEAIPPYYHHHLQLLYNAITWSRYQKPQHELTVSLETPQAVKPGDSKLVNATVSNMGTSNETNVELQLIINNVVVNSATIPELWAGDSYSLYHLWTPTIEGIYNITAYAIPVPGEDDIINNVKSVKVYVSALSVALFQNYDSWDYPSNQEALDRYGVPYVVFRSSDFGRADLSGFTKVVIASDQDQAFYNGMDTYRSWFENYVSNGGILEIHAADWGWHGGRWIGSLPGGLQWTEYPSQYVTVVDPIHPLLTTPNTITEAELDNWNYAAHGYFNSYPVDAHIIIVEDYTRMPAYLEFGYGSGFIIASSQALEWAYKRRFSLILENSLLYMPVRYEHDIAVTLEIAGFLVPGESSLVNATVRNRGLSNETNVELQLLIDDTIVDSVLILELPTEASYTLTYHWTPTIEGLYNVTAYAPPVPDEESEGNNVASKNVKVHFVTARVAVLNSWEIPSYFTGGWSNNYQLLVDALNAQGFYAQAITNEEITSGTLSFFDVFVMIDNVPNDAAVPCVVNFWSNGGGLVAFDSSICFLCYAGVLPPESAGNNGYYVYWDYGTSNQAKISIEHPVTAGYEVGQIIYGTSGDAEYWVEALAGTGAYPYYTMLVEDVTIPNRAYTSAYEPPIGGNVVHIWDALHWGNTNLQLMILNAMEWAKAPRYEHDLGASLDAPSYLEPHEPFILRATVHNLGSSNETNVDLQLLINGTIVASSIIPNLPISSSYTLNYLWIPTVEGTYNVTAYAPPLANEIHTTNNVASAHVSVATIHETSLRVVPRGSIAMVDRNFTISVNIFNVTDLFAYDFQMFYDTRILDGLEIEVPPDHFLAPTDPANIFWVKREIIDNFDATRGRIWVAVMLLPPEPPKNGSGVLVNIIFKAKALGSSILHLANTMLVKLPGEEMPHIALDGSVEVVPQIPADVAIVSVTPSSTAVYEGRIVNITVVARNEGNTTETFNVTAYYDSNIIGTQLVVDLPLGENITLTFNWNTTGLTPCHSYTISAYAWPVPGEIDTGDNVLSDGTVKIAMLGDVNADGTINILDLVKAAMAFGAVPGSPLWDPLADVYPDNRVNIFDLVAIALRFGQHC